MPPSPSTRRRHLQPPLHAAISCQKMKSINMLTNRCAALAGIIMIRSRRFARESLLRRNKPGKPDSFRLSRVYQGPFCPANFCRSRNTIRINSSGFGRIERAPTQRRAACSGRPASPIAFRLGRRRHYVAAGSQAVVDNLFANRLIPRDLVALGPDLSPGIWSRLPFEVSKIRDSVAQSSGFGRAHYNAAKRVAKIKTGAGVRATFSAAFFSARPNPESTMAVKRSRACQTEPCRNHDGLAMSFQVTDLSTVGDSVTEVG